jgi:uncharacterized paraquat-inducible protein A
MTWIDVTHALSTQTEYLCCDETYSVIDLVSERTKDKYLTCQYCHTISENDYGCCSRCGAPLEDNNGILD